LAPFGEDFVTLAFAVLDEGSCEAVRAELTLCLVFVFLLDLPAEGLPDFDSLPFADTFGAGAADPAGDLGDFLRVFLDIRLPFVAFRGSIIALLRQTGIKAEAGRGGPAQSMLKGNWRRYPSAR
jgi:hypothetical protein